MTVGTHGCSLTIMNKLVQNFLSLVAKTSDVSGDPQNRYFVPNWPYLSFLGGWFDVLGCVSHAPSFQVVETSLHISIFKHSIFFWAFLEQNGDTVVSNPINRIPNNARVWVFTIHTLDAPNSTTQREETNCVTGRQEELLTLTLLTQNNNSIYRNVK